MLRIISHYTVFVRKKQFCLDKGFKKFTNLYIGSYSCWMTEQWNLHSNRCKKFCIVIFQKRHLLKLNVPQLFMMVALDDGPGPPIKYQYAELSKLYSVVSQLVRCCDVSSKCTSSVVSICLVLWLPNFSNEDIQDCTSFSHNLTCKITILYTIPVAITKYPKRKPDI